MRLIIRSEAKLSSHLEHRFTIANHIEKRKMKCECVMNVNR
jgi:hypothetical protein